MSNKDFFQQQEHEDWSLLALNDESSLNRLNNVVRIYEDDITTRNPITDTEETAVFHTLEVRRPNSDSDNVQSNTFPAVNIGSQLEVEVPISNSTSTVNSDAGSNFQIVEDNGEDQCLNSPKETLYEHLQQTDR